MATLAWTCTFNGGSQTVNHQAPNGPESDTAWQLAAAYELFWLKCRLVDAGWTVVQSCAAKATSPVTYDCNTDDNWGTSFASYKYVWGTTATSNRSWVALQSPDTTHHVIIDCNGTDRSFVTVIFVKGSITTGSQNGRPTGTYWWGKRMKFFDATVAKSVYLMNFHAVTSGTGRGAFWFAPSVSGGTPNFSSCIAFLPIQNTHGTDNYPWVAFLLANNNAVSNMYVEDLSLTDRTLSTTVVQGLYTGTGTPTPMVCAMPSATKEGGVLSGLFNTLLTGSNASDQTWTEFPIMVASLTPGEYKGILPDFSWAPALLTPGAVYPTLGGAVTHYEKTKLGNVWIPWVADTAPAL